MTTTTPPGWRKVPLSHLLTSEQIDKISKAKTIKEIKEITASDTTKMKGLADPDFLAYSIAHKMGIFT